MSETLRKGGRYFMGYAIRSGANYVALFRYWRIAMIMLPQTSLL